MKKKDLTFNEAMARIEEIVETIENGEPNIDKLSETVKEASDLIKRCREMLRETEKEIDGIMQEDSK